MAKYATSFVYDKGTGSGKIKVMHPIKDEITVFYLNTYPEFSTLDEFEENVFSQMPLAKQKKWTEEMKAKAVKDEVDLAEKRLAMTNLFLEKQELVNEFGDMLYDDPNTAFMNFCNKHSI